MIAPAADDLVIPADHPELCRLAWNRDPRRPIPGVEALSLYKANWRHVDTDALLPAEWMLIRALTHRHGHGHFLGDADLG